MGVAAGSLAAISTGLDVAGSISSARTAARNQRQAGRESAISAFLTAAQLERAAAAGEAQAAEVDTYLRRRTENALGNIDAVLALSGRAPASPTAFAVRNRFEFLSDEARDAQRENILADARAKRSQVALYMLNGFNVQKSAEENAKNIELSGFLSGTGTLLKRLSFAIPGSGPPLRV